MLKRLDDKELQSNSIEHILVNANENIRKVIERSIEGRDLRLEDCITLFEAEDSGLSSIFLILSVFFLILTSSLQPPSRYSNANFGILFFASLRKSSTEGYLLSIRLLFI